MAEIPEISSEERIALKKKFDIYDLNKDGHITRKELRTVMKTLGQNPTEEQVAEIIRQTDTNKNGMIEFNEFCRYLTDLRMSVFKKIDADGDGYITPEEVVKGYETLGGRKDMSLDEAKRIVKKLDKDGDGRISYKEFIKSLEDNPLI